LRGAAEQDPGNVDVRVALGELLQAAGAAEGALSAFLEAVRLGPNRPDAQLGLALALIAVGRGDEAEAPARAAGVRLSVPEAKRALAHALHAQGRHAEGLAALDEAVQVHPQSRAARADRALSLHRAGHSDDALRAFDELGEAN